MSNQYFNFYYDPVRQGYDSNTWNTISGVPAVVNNYLELDNAEIIHFADILRGDVVFNINISAPAAGDDIKLGFIEKNGSIFAHFKIADDVLTAETSNGITIKSVVVDWNSDWTVTDTEFRIKWEAGAVNFYIGGPLLVTINYSSLLDVPTSVVPGTPMSLFLHSNSPDALLLKYLSIKGIQGLIWS